MSTASAEVTIVNRLGLHARAAAALVKVAGRFASKIELVNEPRRADAKSIMAVMVLAATQGTTLSLSAQGEDAEQAVAAVTALIADRFGENE
ncbi:MAG: HPr family phosphocarrier protein [Gammaproteobacteria bacterium]|nr:HPr family phosphocarrier protein [Gammaproteobacteria bacterium]